MSSSTISFLLLLLATTFISSTTAKPHIINFHSPNLYPEGLTYDPAAQHFIVGSLYHRTIHSVSDAGIVETLISDPSLPPNSTVLGLAVDSRYNRLLAVIHSAPPLSPFNALAAYDLTSRSRLFLSLLPESNDVADKLSVANDVAVDFKGNAYVTNSGQNLIWKVNSHGEASIFSRSPSFTEYPIAVDQNSSFSDCGLNGIAYVSKGYLLVVQSNTGKMFKVNEDDGRARPVLLTEDLPLADGISLRKDGVVLVVSPNKLWYIKSDDSWSEGVVYDQTDLDIERFPTSVTIGREDRAYVLYGSVFEGMMGNGKREWFDIEEVNSVKESKEENIWIFVLIGLGFAYFCFWRFQMKQLVTNLDKKNG
ncbi:uncharacterized protein LOC126683187 [Mercurialis annua]|uniref:uncharacterized protein LOC126683187 n=1 Tax=Mercurialis annua TaxID=3986 RepID=UPI002160DC66|nr:uncharacterized protein LOC126683187 [Mercurialis annua]